MIFRRQGVDFPGTLLIKEMSRDIVQTWKESPYLQISPYDNHIGKHHVTLTRNGVHM